METDLNRSVPGSTPTPHLCLASRSYFSCFQLKRFLFTSFLTFLHAGLGSATARQVTGELSCRHAGAPVHVGLQGGDRGNGGTAVGAGHVARGVVVRRVQHRSKTEHGGRGRCVSTRRRPPRHHVRPLGTWRKERNSQHRRVASQKRKRHWNQFFL